MSVWGLTVHQYEPEPDGEKYVMVRKEGVEIVEIEKHPIAPAATYRQLMGAVKFTLTRQEALNFADDLREQALQLPEDP